MISKRHKRRLVKKEKEKLLMGLNFGVNFGLQRSEQEIGQVLENAFDCAQSSVSSMHNDSADALSVVESGENACGDNLSLLENSRISLRQKLQNWRFQYNVPRRSVDSLLVILRSEGLKLPKSADSLKKKSKFVIRTVCPGTYVHIGLSQQLEKIASSLEGKSEIYLDFGIDGLPLFKSSKRGLWPILGKVANESKTKPFPIGIYFGPDKPASLNNFLHDFAYELSEILQDGIMVGKNIVDVKIRSFICDAPARAFICQTIQHNGFEGCSKCTAKAWKIGGTTVYPTCRGEPKTDIGFKNRVYPKYHKTTVDPVSELEKLNVGMVSQVPLDPMHLIDLGVTKKVLTLLIDDKSCSKIKKEDVLQLSEKLLSFAPYIIKEFARKPRSLDEVKRWKATEFRQFVLYTGVVALKGIVSDDFYYHFTLLHCAYRLLSMEENYESNLEPAKAMIDDFVNFFPSIFSEKNVTYNVHSVLHITECVRDVGFIPTFSAYCFENYLQHIKRIDNNPSKVLETIYNKLQNECYVLKTVDVGFQLSAAGVIKCYKTKSFELTAQFPNNFCYTKTKVAYVISSFVNENGGFFKGKRLTNCESFYKMPVDSMKSMCIFTAAVDPNAEEQLVPISEIAYKLLQLPYMDSFVYFPLLSSSKNVL